MRKGDMVHPQWEELPQGILWGLIFQRLPLVDRVHCSVVCKRWSSALKQTPRPAWILVNHTIFYFDMGEGAIGKMNLPEFAPKRIIMGASRGWLALHTTKDLQFFLFDPISMVRIPLPPLSTLRSASEETIGLVKIEISSKDASQAVVAASFEGGKILALCRPEDKSWTIFEGLGVDLCIKISFCKGVLYAIIIPESNEATLQVQTHFMKLTGDHDVLLKLIPFSMLEISYPIFLEDPLGEVVDPLMIPYLVESNGELLLLLKILVNDHQHNQPQISYNRLVTFQVFKVEASDTLCLTRLSNLDDQTLFLDGMDAESLSEEKFDKNCICFFEDSFVYTGEGWKPITSPGFGVFHLNDGRIEGPLPCLDIVKGRNCSWFFPNIKIGGFN